MDISHILSALEIRDRLQRPEKSGDIQLLLKRWHITNISLLVQQKIKPSELSSLPGRLRGGWGEKLVMLASESARENGLCNWQSACGLFALFNEHGTMDKGLQIPRPYIFEILPLFDTGQIFINLRLFGFSGLWAGEAATALRLLMLDGMEWHEGKKREEAKIIDMSIYPQTMENFPDGNQMNSVTSAFLDFITPLSLRRQGVVTADITAMPLSLINRIKGLARWHGMELEVDRSFLKEQAQRLRYDSRNMRAEGWYRCSGRQNRRIPMEGLSGMLVVEGELTSFIPYLWLGQDSLVGSHTTSGMGRYQLELVGGKIMND